MLEKPASCAASLTQMPCTAAALLSFFVTESAYCVNRLSWFGSQTSGWTCIEPLSIASKMTGLVLSCSSTSSPRLSSRTTFMMFAVALTDGQLGTPMTTSAALANPGAPAIAALSAPSATVVLILFFGIGISFVGPWVHPGRRRALRASASVGTTVERVTDGSGRRPRGLAANPALDIAGPSIAECETATPPGRRAEAPPCRE